MLVYLWKFLLSGQDYESAGMKSFQINNFICGKVLKNMV